MRGWFGWLGALGLLLPSVSSAQALVPSVLVERRGEVHGARLLAATATDPLRHRTLLFGGYTNGGIRNDTLEWDGAGWTKRTPSIVPGPRYAASMVYESKRRRILLFGGVQEHRGDKGFELSENFTWEWAGGDWRVLSTQTAPPARGSAAMAADPITGDVYLFGGGNEASSLDDFYRFDGQQWTAIPKPAAGAWPAARSGATLGFDPISKKLVLFGGMTSFAINASGNPAAGDPFVDTWIWDGSAWTELQPAAHPEGIPPLQLRGDSIPLTGRSNLVADERRGCLLLVQEAIEGIQIWRWDPGASNWIKEFTPTDPVTPNLRVFSGSFWDAARSEVHVVGGLGTNVKSGTSLGQILLDPTLAGDVIDGRMANEEWGYDGNAWRRWRAAGEPSARMDAAIAFHEELRVGVLFGGRFGSNTVLGDNFLWDGGRWYEGVTVDGGSGTRPSARMSHAMAYDPARGGGAIVLFGGVDSSGTPLADTWVWRDGWTQLTTPSTGGPAPREQHVLAAVPGGVVLYGGVDTNDTLPETWFLASGANAWEQLSVRIPERADMCAASYGSSAYVYGGDLRGGGVLDTVFQQFAPGRTWSPLPNPVDGPERRSGCTLVGDPTHGQLILAGGRGPGEAKPNWHRYDVAGATWSAMTPRPYDTLGEIPGRSDGGSAFYDSVTGSVTVYGGERRDLEIVVGGTWRLRQVGAACAEGQACTAGLTCVDGTCCESSACGPCESCAMPGHAGVCSPRGIVQSVPGCPAEEGVACNVEGRCRGNEGAACTEGAQCASGSCAAGTCCSAEGCAERCIDDATQKNKDGSTTACGAYTCKGTACLVSCTSVAECSAGNVCSADQRCVPADAPDTEQDGCSCDVPGAPGHWPVAGISLVALCLFGVRRRRRYWP